MTTISKRKIFLRADGDSKTGLGHIYRCLAVSEILRGQSEIIFIIRNPSSALLRMIKNYCNAIITLSEKAYSDEADDVSQLLTSQDIIIIDGYKFDTVYQSRLKISGARVVCIDDIHNFHFTSDVVINHAGGVSRSEYDIADYTKLYLGPSYAIIRSEFWNKPSVSRRHMDNVLISLGGADPNNDVLSILGKVLETNDSLTYHIITGSAYAFENVLVEFISGKTRIHHYKNVDAEEMKMLMQKCAIAICSPSTVSYEYLSIGGELYLYPIADNQVNIYNYFTAEALAFPFEKFRVSEKQQIQAALKKQQEIFDGKSYERLKMAILNEHNSSL